MSSIYDWSIVAANNATSDSAINWAEGQAPNTVNNSARQLEARVAEILADLGGALTAGGTANALTVTANSAFTAYRDGLVLSLRIATDNSAAATLNVNAIGAKSIRKMLTTGESALVGAELQATGIYLLEYSTALNGAAGGWLLLNPTDVLPTASTTVPGIVELATDAEAIARSSTTVAITPSNLAAAIGPASSTDNVVVRRDGTGGKTQDSGVTIDDSNNIVTTGNVTGATATFTANVNANASFVGPNSGVILASTGAGSVFLRPNGFASATGQASLSSGGALDATSFTKAGTALPFQKAFESTQQTVTQGGALTLAHSLGVQPKLITGALKCLTAENGYSIGDELQISNGLQAGGSFGQGVSIVPDATNINIRYGSHSNIIDIIHKTNGNVVGITPTSWALIARAWA